VIFSFAQFKADGKSEGFKTHSWRVIPGGQEEEVENAITKALEELKNGDRKRALDLLAEAMMMIQSGEELSIQKLALCTEIRGYRDFTAIEGNTIQNSEPLLLYIEPGGFKIKKEDDEFKIWISEDASILNESGEIIFQRNNWVEYKREFASPVIPFFITNRVREIPPGKYTFKFTLKDHYKNTFLSETYEFIVK
jgi:hypothetical protein